MLAGDKFIPTLDLIQSGFAKSPCGQSTKHPERIQKFKETGDSNYILKGELDKAYFSHDAEYSDSKYLAKRTISGKILIIFQ